MVRANYRPDPTDALAFCEAASSACGSRPDSRTSRSMTTSAPDSAPNVSGQSTPTGVLGGFGGRAAAAGGGKGSVPAGESRVLYGGIEHDSVDSLPAAGAAAGATAAVDAAALLNRQAAAAGVPHAIMSSVTEVDGWCSVHSQPDPHFVCECMRGCFWGASACWLGVKWSRRVRDAA